jgi:hypothetical protein
MKDFFNLLIVHPEALDTLLLVVLFIFLAIGMVLLNIDKIIDLVRVARLPKPTSKHVEHMTVIHNHSKDNSNAS